MVVLLPLAALGAIVVAVRPTWRRTYSIPVLLIAIVGVAAVPLATNTGEQLAAVVPGPNPLILIRETRGETLLPVAVAFLVLLAVAVTVGGRTDSTGRHGSGATVVRTGSRVAAVAAVLAAPAGLAVTGLVVWIGHSGAAAVWQAPGG